MTSSSVRRPSSVSRLVFLLVAAVACSHDVTGPSDGPPAHLRADVDLSRSATVGAAVPGGITVTVTDAAGRPVRAASVSFSVTVGNGSANPRIATTDAKGQATTAWTLGTIAGANELTAAVAGVDAIAKFQATGTAGAVNSLSISPSSVRLPPNVSTTTIVAMSLDVFGNVTSPPPTLTVRDPSLLAIDAAGVAHVLRRGAATYVIANAGSKADSVLVTVLDLGQSICTGAADPLELAVGQVITDISASGVCVHAATAGAEYAIVPFYNAGSSTASVPIELLGQGVAPLSLASATFSPSRLPQPGSTLVPDDEFESRLRDRERLEIPKRIAGARSWQGARRSISPSGAAALAVPAIGDLLKLNANATGFCSSPDVRVGRVVAVTDKAIVVADTANPAGGFSDADYRSIGVTFDTLIDPVDRAAFGAASDIDNNGHVILFFTRAVNELTSSGASSVVLGFFYQRDLLPKTSTSGQCVGSNVAEMFYLLVPDPTGVVNGNKRSTTQVLTLSNGTVAHEYQHLINASRRLYVNGTSTTEEKWLDEGLAHVAEELNFFRSSGRAPRTNLDASGFTDTRFAAAYATFEVNNFNRYKSYLTRTEFQSPIGSDPLDDDIPTRGAIWNFLRFAADHVPDGQENTFWFNLVNSQTSGLANLTSALGTAPNSLLRDWAISVFLDDNAANVDARFQESSWNLRSAMTNGGTSLAFPLVTRLLADNTSATTTLAPNGVAFYRFSVPAAQDALVTVTSAGQALPSSVQLAVVRVR